MKRPITQTPRRPRMASVSVAKTPKEAAISLVRLEFDAARLRMGIEQARNRIATYQHDLERNDAQRRMIMHFLSAKQS